MGHPLQRRIDAVAGSDGLPGVRLGVNENGLVGGGFWRWK